MSELYFLGTGGSVATLDRDNTSFLVNSGRELILVDCPGSVIQKIRKTGSNPSEVSSILVTHIHPDHIYGLPSFVHSLMFVDSVIRIYGSEESVGFSQKLLEMFHLLDKDKKIRVDFIPLNPNQKIKLDDSLEIFAFPVPHSSASLAFQFTFVESGKQLLYSSDTPIYSTLFEKAEGIDFLIHDCSAPSRFFRKYPSLRTMHSDSLELGHQAQQAKVKCLIPCHFFGELDFNITEIEEEIKKNYQGKLIIPNDLDRISLETVNSKQ